MAQRIRTIFKEKKEIYIKDYIIWREIMEKKLYSFTKEARFDDRDSYTDIVNDIVRIIIMCYM